MNRIALLPIILFFLAGQILLAGDSLKVKSPRFLLDLNYGWGHFFAEKSSNDPDFMFGPTITISSLNSVQMDLQYALAKKTFIYQENAFYIGMGADFTNFRLNITKPEPYSSGGHFPTYYSYSPTNFVTHMNVLNYRLFIEHVFTELKFFFSQKLGLSSFYPLSGPATITYTLAESGGYPVQDPSSPGGYSFYSFNANNKVTEQYKLSAGLSAFYNLRFGLNLKRFVPYAGVELMYFNNSISSSQQAIYRATALKLQVGAAYRF